MFERSSKTSMKDLNNTETWFAPWIRSVWGFLVLGAACQTLAQWVQWTWVSHQPFVSNWSTRFRFQPNMADGQDKKVIDKKGTNRFWKSPTVAVCVSGVGDSHWLASVAFARNKRWRRFRHGQEASKDYDGWTSRMEPCGVYLPTIQPIFLSEQRLWLRCYPWGQHNTFAKIHLSSFASLLANFRVCLGPIYFAIGPQQTDIDLYLQTNICLSRYYHVQVYILLSDSLSV